MPISEQIMAHRDLIELWCYFMILPIMAGWEALSPRGELKHSLRQRWFANFTLFISSVAVIRWFAPVLCAGLAVFMAERGIGLFNMIADLPEWLVFAVSFLVIDLTRYCMHVLLHRVPLFWRFHRLHHTDQDFDFTTSIRFHPFELVLAVLFNFSIIALLGIPPEAVILTEAIAFLVNTANHGNVRIAPFIDRILRLVIVTPDMHRIHHSTRRQEFDANLGGLLSWWDRLFGTYVAKPSGGHGKMQMGLPDFQDDRHLTLRWMLAIPFLPMGIAERTGSPERPVDDR